METIKLPNFAAEADKDAMMYNAIYEYSPVWPRWERLSDVQALLSIEASNVASEASQTTCVTK